MFLRKLLGLLRREPKPSSQLIETKEGRLDREPDHEGFNSEYISEKNSYMMIMNRERYEEEVDEKNEEKIIF